MKVMMTLAAIAIAIAIAIALSLQAEIRLVEPKGGACVPTLSVGQKAYLKMPREERIACFADYAKRDEMCKLTGCPQPVSISWQGGAAHPARARGAAQDLPWRMSRWPHTPRPSPSPHSDARSRDCRP